LAVVGSYGEIITRPGESAGLVCTAAGGVSLYLVTDISYLLLITLALSG